MVRLGSRRPIPLDVRLVAATNIDLRARGRRRSTSAPTCTTASAWPACACRRCTSARPTSCRWPSISSASTATGWRIRRLPLSAGRRRRAAALQLAGQHPRAGERHPLRADRVRGRRDPGQRPEAGAAAAARRDRRARRPRRPTRCRRLPPAPAATLPPASPAAPAPPPTRARACPPCSTSCCAKAARACSTPSSARWCTRRSTTRTATRCAPRRALGVTRNMVRTLLKRHGLLAAGCAEREDDDAADGAARRAPPADAGGRLSLSAA